jgi:histone demethylase JARID1
VPFPQFNCGEAVNFACSDWLVSGGHAEERYRGFGRESVFSHQRLLFTLLHHRQELVPHCWKE